MNQLILELAEQAENYAYSAVIGGEECQEAYTKKFAELLVRECAKYVKNTNCFTYASQADLCAERMKQHFGVK